jgi:hypothetical protein
MATEAAEVIKDKETPAAAPESGAQAGVQLPEFDLEPEVESEVESAVLAAHTGKAKDQLEAEIKAAKEAKKKELVETYKPLLDKANALKALPENEGKTDDELLEMAQAEIEKGTPDGDDTPKLGEDFFGVGAKAEKKDAQAGTKPATEFVVPDEYKPQWERAKKITEDPLADIYFKAKEAGQVKDFMDLLGRMTPDPDTLSPEQLKEMQVRSYDPNITPDDLAEVMEEFKEKKTYQKKEEVSLFAAQMRQARENDLKLLEGNVTSKATASKESTAKAIQEAEKELNGSYKGQTFYGVEVTEEVARKVLNNIRQNGVSFTRPDGAPDVQKSIQATLREEYFQDMLQAAFERGLKTATRKEAIKRSKPLTGLKTRGGIVKAPVVSRQERLEKAWKEKEGTKS